MRTIRISMAQINPIVGDLAGNRDKIIDYISRAKKLGADIVAFPELAVTGYPPEDLLLKPQFVKDNLRTLKEIARATQGHHGDRRLRRQQTNYLYQRRRDPGPTGSMSTPTTRYSCRTTACSTNTATSSPASRYPVLTVKGVGVGVNICEDIWYAKGPTRVQALAGAEVIVNINASPYHKGKGKERLKMLVRTGAGEQRRRRLHQHRRRTGRTGLRRPEHGPRPEGQTARSGQTVRGRTDHRGHHASPAMRTVASRATGTSISDFIDYVVISGQAGREEETASRADSRQTLSGAAKKCTTRSCSARGTTCERTGSSPRSSASRAASIRRSWPPLPWRPSGKRTCIGVFMPSQYSSNESREDACELARNLGIKILEHPHPADLRCLSQHAARRVRENKDRT